MQAPVHGQGSAPRALRRWRVAAHRAARSLVLAAGLAVLALLALLGSPASLASPRPPAATRRRTHSPAAAVVLPRAAPPCGRCRRQLGAPIPPVSRRESRGRRALIINHRRGSSRALSDARRAPGSSCTIAGAAAPRGSQGERKRRGNNPETFVLDCAQVREGSSLVPPS